MGINNDIRPKKTYSYKPAHSHTPVEVTPEDEEEVVDPELDQATEHLSSFGKYEEETKPDEDFFDDQKSVKQQATGGHKKKGMSKFAKAILWLLVLALAGVLIYQNWSYLYHLAVPEKTSEATETRLNSYTSSGTSDSSSATSPSTTTPAPVVTAPVTTPTAPAATTVDKTFVIEVLNGNGISGSADKVRDSLVSAGFNVTKVANAKSFSYASTYIYYKTGKESASSQVKAALSSRTCIEEKSDTVTGSLYDVVVVVGAK